MRLFWAMIGVLMVAASAYLLLGKSTGVVSQEPGINTPAGSGPALARARPNGAEPSPDKAPLAAPITPVAQGEGSAAPANRGTPNPEVMVPTPSSNPPAINAAPAKPKSSEPEPAGSAESTKSATPVTNPVAPDPPVVAPFPGAHQPVVEQPPSASQPPQPAAVRPAPPAPAPGEPNFLESLKPPPETPPPAPPAGPAAVKIQTNEDGTMLVDGKYKVKGNGTAEAPYQVTWDHLVSAQDEYVPRSGRTELPGRISMLNGKWVEITGNIAFPIMAETQEDCLSMMNQWDGCCIGIPPTPYDAVEVRLKTAIEGQARLTTYGVVRGKFSVDPQLVGGWLIGLYVMDQATLKPQAFGGFAP